MRRVFIPTWITAIGVCLWAGPHLHYEAIASLVGAMLAGFGGTVVALMRVYFKTVKPVLGRVERELITVGSSSSDSYGGTPMPAALKLERVWSSVKRLEAGQTELRSALSSESGESLHNFMSLRDDVDTAKRRIVNVERNTNTQVRAADRWRDERSGEHET